MAFFSRNSRPSRCRKPCRRVSMAAVIILGLNVRCPAWGLPRHEERVHRRAHRAAAATHEGSCMRHVRRLSCLYEEVHSCVHNRTDLSSPSALVSPRKVEGSLGVIVLRFPLAFPQSIIQPWKECEIHAVAVQTRGLL